jgi:hypothetical protein
VQPRRQRLKIGHGFRDQNRSAVDLHALYDAAHRRWRRIDRGKQALRVRRGGQVVDQDGTARRVECVIGPGVLLRNQLQQPVLLAELSIRHHARAVGFLARERAVLLAPVAVDRLRN